ncbi:cation transporter (plasmid) [Lichenicola cladoniae]|uniref:Cation transporter n=1 Tax=Lichenicola cladoniae TaxID=1484109 RepID=A0A6M8I1C2_9PROT|nr:cation transporter [Acetobacteraceae bacterium]QKE93841.1 cation transporter [Lichenicola cladoniae]
MPLLGNVMATLGIGFERHDNHPGQRWGTAPPSSYPSQRQSDLCTTLAHHDNNLRAAIVHVLADAAVSVLVIVGLLLARAFGWLWMDPLAGLIGAGVIAVWSYGLVRNTGAILLDMIPDQRIDRAVRQAIEAEGDQLADFHLWRLGPGHLGAILSIVTDRPSQQPEHYHRLLTQFPALSHVTVEVQRA